jgi:hypothetical protein
MDDLQSELKTQTSFYVGLAGPSGRLGKIQAEIDKILAEAQASNLTDYMRKRAAMLTRVNDLVAELLRLNNFVTALLRAPGIKAVESASAGGGSELVASWNQVQTAWKAKCSAGSRKWYCR